MSTITRDVCDLSYIYDKAGGFDYFFPKEILKTYMSGNSFDYKKDYTSEESSKAREDVNALYQKILSLNPVKENLAVLTAGAPGSGKTIKLRQELDAYNGRKSYAYVDPDDVCLKTMTNTYQAEIENSDGSPEARLNAYNKWRPFSNAATHLLVANLIRENYALYFGTTASSPQTGKFLDFLIRKGYQIHIIHVSAPDKVRWESIKKRDATFIQTTEQDVNEKGLLVPQRITDTYLKYADTIDFYYRDAADQDAKLAAVWYRNVDTSEKLGTLLIVKTDEYEKLKTVHNTATEILGRKDLRWESTVELQSQLISKQ